jgi:hypothetical protein
MEKAEYWALVWGTVVMAATGILLWAHNWILAHLPYSMSFMDIATAVHFYEAILATSSILIWHLYFVIFDPEVYPLKWTVLTGRAPEHELREEVIEPTPEGSEQMPLPAADCGVTSVPTSSPTPAGGKTANNF